jgi:hypothetical protein
MGIRAFIKLRLNMRRRTTRLAQLRKELELLHAKAARYTIEFDKESERFVGRSKEFLSAVVLLNDELDFLTDRIRVIEKRFELGLTLKGF